MTADPRMTVKSDYSPRHDAAPSAARAEPALAPDPSDPLVFDVRELGRRPGALRRVRLSAPAAAGLSVGIAGVPDGTEIALDLRLEAVVEGVLASGTVRSPVAGECSRCLDDAATTVEAELCQLYAYSGERPDDEDIGELYGDLLDLRPAVRDAVVLELPLAPLCRPDCPGLCSVCGARLADVEAGHAHPQLDSRWAALSDLLPTLADDSGEH
jgi:uncharacterized protein